MGWNQREARIIGFTDNHNSPKTKTDNAMWDELMYDIKKVVDNPRFAALNVDFQYSLSDDSVY